MEWSFIIGMLVTGLLLVFIEIIFVPGTTFIGVIGFIISSIAVYFAFKKGDTEGLITLGATATIMVVLLVIGFKSGIWMRYSLKETITGRVNESKEGIIKTGDEGKALSDLRPMGKAEINDQLVEVRTLGNFCDTGTDVKVIKVDNNKIYVEPKS